MKKISHENFIRLLDSLKDEYEIFLPVKKNNQRFFSHYPALNGIITTGEVRPFEPLKAFFTKAREVVAENFNPSVPSPECKPLALVGVKNCDLKGFAVQDYVFLDEDYIDPFYSRYRRQNLIISSDCTCSIDTCFCLALGIKPFPTNNFDINLSLLGDLYIVESNSEKGASIISRHQSLFGEADESLIKKRNEQRERVVKEIEQNLKEHGIPRAEQLKDIIEKNYDSNIWLEESKTCVECGACTIICPSCHCFLLYDQKNVDAMERMRVWDSCMLKNYARVAGGANPRPKLWTRLRNRFEKKFYFFPKVADTYACSGCGRCVSACPAKIDIRKVLKRLVESDAGKQ